VDEIMSLAKSRDVADRERLLIRLVDLCDGNSDELRLPRVQALLSQVFFDLVFQAEYDIRLRLAEKIASADWAPSALINILSFDDIEIARPIIARSPILKDPDLVRILVEATLEHQVEVARRPQISPKVVDAIIKAAKPEVMTALVENETAEVSQDHLYELVHKAEEIASLHQPLSEHPALNDELAGYLYAWVGDTLRKSLATKFELDTRALDWALSQSVNEAKAGKSAGPRLRALAPSETDEERSDRQLVTKLDMSGQLRPGFLVKALKDRRLSLFIAGLATLGRFESREIRKALESNRPEVLALACAAVGVDRTVFPSLLAQVRNLNNGLPGGGLEGDKRAMAIFTRANPSAATAAFRRAVAEI
jgi:uncharacterized protein (DUF2336 family)